MQTNVDRTLAAKDAEWWAIDASGEAHWFVAPNVAAFTDFWYSKPAAATDFGYSGDGRKSLVKRKLRA